MLFRTAKTWQTTSLLPPHMFPPDLKTYLNLHSLCSCRRARGLLSCVGVPCVGVAGLLLGPPAPELAPFFLRADLRGTAWNFGSFAGISSIREVSIEGSGWETRYWYLGSPPSSSSNSSSASSISWSVKQNRRWKADQNNSVEKHFPKAGKLKYNLKK